MSVEQNCADRNAAKDLFWQMIELMKPEIAKLPSDRSRALFFEMLHSAASHKMDPKPTCIAPPAPPKPQPSPARNRIENSSVDEALNLVQEILIKSKYVKSEGQAFAESVSEKAESIGETIERTGRASDKQVTALSNMSYGLDKWLENDDWESDGGCDDEEPAARTPARSAPSYSVPDDGIPF